MEPSPRRFATAAMSSPPTFPPRERRSRLRPAVVLTLSALLHALILWWSQRQEPPPPSSSERTRFELSVVERPVARAPVADGKPDNPPTTPASPRPPPERRAPPPLSGDEIARRTPSPTPSGGPPAERAPPGPAASPKGPDLGAVRLFDPAVIGQGLRRQAGGRRTADRLQAAGDDPDSPGAEAARVGARLRDQLGDLAAAANVGSGYISACDDGIDNNIDGEIDCADAGCRQMPVCDTTGIWRAERPQPIPEGAGPLASALDVRQEGRIRKLSLHIDLLHAAPGDLALTLVSPDGRRYILRDADRGEASFKKAYYVRAAIGHAAAGRWTLEVEDRFEGTTGALRGWTMFVTT
jgi:hypothetical protein